MREKHWQNWRLIIVEISEWQFQFRSKYIDWHFTVIWHCRCRLSYCHSTVLRNWGGKRSHIIVRDKILKQRNQHHLSLYLNIIMSTNPSIYGLFSIMNYNLIVHEIRQLADLCPCHLCYIHVSLVIWNDFTDLHFSYHIISCMSVILWQAVLRGLVGLYHLMMLLSFKMEFSWCYICVRVVKWTSLKISYACQLYIWVYFGVYFWVYIWVFF